MLDCFRVVTGQHSDQTNSFSMQILIAVLAGVGIFTVLHMLGIGTVYKVRSCPLKCDQPSSFAHLSVSAQQCTSTLSSLVLSPV